MNLVFRLLWRVGGTNLAGDIHSQTLDSNAFIIVLASRFVTVGYYPAWAMCQADRRRYLVAMLTARTRSLVGGNVAIGD